MTQTNFPGPGSPQGYAAPTPPPKQPNLVGLIAFIVAIVGFIFACIPGALIVGWLLLPIAIVLAIVSLCLHNKKRALGLAGLIIAVVGGIVGAFVFFAVVANAFNEAFSQSDVSVAAASQHPGAETDNHQDGSAAKEGSRTNPYALGSEISGRNWTVVINSVDLDATDEIKAENRFNDPAPEGEVYIMANATLTYTGEDSSDDMPAGGIEYVTTSGNTVHSYDTHAVAPDPLDAYSTLYEGASTSGNVVFSVPADSAGDGVLAVRAGMISDKVFVSVK